MVHGALFPFDRPVGENVPGNLAGRRRELERVNVGLPGDQQKAKGDL